MCGFDVGLIEFVYMCIVEICDVGVFVIVVFIEFDEVVVFVDWIVVMYWGEIVGIVLVNIDCDILGFMMVGEFFEMIVVQKGVVV